MASLPQTCGYLLLPERIDALNAVARLIGKIRVRRGLKPEDIARTLKQEDGESPHKDTISRAERAETLLSFDLIVHPTRDWRDPRTCTCARGRLKEEDNGRREDNNAHPRSLRLARCPLVRGRGFFLRFVFLSGIPEK